MAHLTSGYIKKTFRKGELRCSLAGTFLLPRNPEFYRDWDEQKK